MGAKLGLFILSNKSKKAKKVIDEVDDIIDSVEDEGEKEESPPNVNVKRTRI